MFGCTPPGHSATEWLCLEMITSEDPLTILLAEDDDNDLVLLRRALTNLGLAEHVTCVPDSEQARAYLKGDGKFANRKEYPRPDLLVMDDRIPRKNGLEVLNWLRRESRFDRLPVVVLSHLSAGQEMIVTRLNAACCIETAEPTEMLRAISEAIVCAFRLASLVPEGAWYRSTENAATGLMFMVGG
jgi:CheY-like chemotaxis protein